MAQTSMHERSTDSANQADRWSARSRQLGVGVLIAFTIKGICTSAMIIAALIAAMDESDSDLFPHLLVWSVACIGGFCLMGGWRRSDRHTLRARANELIHKRTH